MKTLNINSILIVILVLFVSCKHDIRYNSVSLYDWNDFKHIQELNSEVYLDETNVFHPTNLEIYGNYLILLDNGEKGFFQIYDIETKKKIAERISKGEGPLDMISPNFVKSDSLYITVWDMITSKVLKYEIDDFVNGDSSNLHIKTKLNSTSYISLSVLGEDFVGQKFGEDSLLCIYDHFGNEKKQFANYPETNEVYNDAILSDAFYFNMVSDAKNKVAICYSMTDLIDIYDSSTGKLLIRLFGPDHFVPYFKQTEVDNIISGHPIEDKCKDAYFVPKNYNNKLYVMYNGRKLSEEEHDSSSDKIFTFTWDGEPNDYYKLDKRIVSYAIDTKHSKIYAITKDPEYHIIVFKYQTSL